MLILLLLYQQKNCLFDVLLFYQQCGLFVIVWPRWHCHLQGYWFQSHWMLKALFSLQRINVEIRLNTLMQELVQKWQPGLFLYSLRLQTGSVTSLLFLFSLKCHGWIYVDPLSVFFSFCCHILIPLKNVVPSMAQVCFVGAASHFFSIFVYLVNHG